MPKLVNKARETECAQECAERVRGAHISAAETAPKPKPYQGVICEVGLPP